MLRWKSSMAVNTSDSKALLSKNIALHAVIENEVNLTPYGELTVNVAVRDGVAMLESLNIVKRKRKRYKFDKRG